MTDADGVTISHATPYAEPILLGSIRVEATKIKQRHLDFSDNCLSLDLITYILLLFENVMCFKPLVLQKNKPCSLIITFTDRFENTCGCLLVFNTTR